MKHAMIAIVVLLFITSLVWAQVQPGDAGEPAPGQVIGQKTAGDSGTPEQRISAPQSQEGKLVVKWQTENKVARAAEDSGQLRVAHHHRQRANVLAVQISRLKQEYRNTQNYLHDGKGYFAELQDAGFITRRQADQRYKPKKSPAVSPAEPVALPAETAAKGESHMNAIWWTYGGIFSAVAIAWLIWSQINNGIRIARGEGYMTRLEEAARGGGQNGGGNGGNGQGQNVDPAYMAAYRSSIGAPTPPAPVGGSLVRGGRYTNAAGQISGWESWEPDRAPVQPTGDTPQANVNLRDLNLTLPEGEQPPFVPSRA